MLDNLGSGVVGLILGAVLGLALSVLFEDGLKNTRTIAARRIRQAWVRGPLPNRQAEFRLGPLQTYVVFVLDAAQQAAVEKYR